MGWPEAFLGAVLILGAFGWLAWQDYLIAKYIHKD